MQNLKKEVNINYNLSEKKIKEQSIHLKNIIYPVLAKNPKFLKENEGVSKSINKFLENCEKIFDMKRERIFWHQDLENDQKILV